MIFFIFALELHFVVFEVCSLMLTGTVVRVLLNFPFFYFDERNVNFQKDGVSDGPECLGIPCE